MVCAFDFELHQRSMAYNACFDSGVLYFLIITCEYTSGSIRMRLETDLAPWIGSMLCIESHLVVRITAGVVLPDEIVSWVSSPVMPHPLLSQSLHSHVCTLPSRSIHLPTSQTTSFSFAIVTTMSSKLVLNLRSLGREDEAWTEGELSVEEFEMTRDGSYWNPLHDDDARSPRSPTSPSTAALKSPKSPVTAGSSSSPYNSPTSPWTPWTPASPGSSSLTALNALNTSAANESYTAYQKRQRSGSRSRSGARRSSHSSVGRRAGAGTITLQNPRTPTRAGTTSSSHESSRHLRVPDSALVGLGRSGEAMSIWEMLDREELG